MNKNQIAALYDSFPESQRDMPKEQFIKKVANALNPNHIATDVEVIVQQRRTGRINQAMIDRALGK